MLPLIRETQHKKQAESHVLQWIAGFALFTQWVKPLKWPKLLRRKG